MMDTKVFFLLAIFSTQVLGSPAPGPSPQWSQYFSLLPPTLKKFVEDTVSEGSEIVEDLSEKAEDIVSDLYEDVMVEATDMMEKVYEDVMEEVVEHDIDVAKYASLVQNILGGMMDDSSEDYYGDYGYDGYGHDDHNDKKSMVKHGKDLTCDQCRDGSIGFGNFISEAERIQKQTEELVDSGICSDDINKAWCEQRLRGFWQFWGPTFWRGSYSYMCEDRVAECGPVPQNTFGNMTMSEDTPKPSCDQCTHRVGGLLEWMLSGAGDEMWVAETKGWFPCTSFYFYQRSQCDEYLEKTIPEAMGTAAEMAKPLVEEWCMSWGCSMK